MATANNGTSNSSRNGSGRTGTGKSATGRTATGRTSSGNTSTAGKKKLTKKQKARKKRKKMLLFGLEALVLVVLVVALFIIQKADKVEKTELDDIVVNEGVGKVDTSGNVEMNDISSAHMEGYRNIALFGVDSRKGALGKGTLSDTIMIASINEKTKEVKLVSVFRDTYLNIDGDSSYNKANSAYSKGGPEQAINMLNRNLDLNISDFVTVGFSGVVDTVDALGGVTIDVDDVELTHLNNYQIGTAEALGRDYTKLKGTGMQNLDGIQATSYCRIRYTKGDDFKRAERQREVVQAIADEAKKASPKTLNKIANSVFPQTATSLELQEILDLIGDLPDYTIVSSDGFPFEDYRATGKIGAKGSCVIPADLQTNVSELHKFLFGAEDYVPSTTVQEYSARISQDTGK